MKYSTRLADSIHILTLIAEHESDCSSTGIARSLATNPAHIRKIMSQLKHGGVISSIRGKAEPSLCRPPQEITLLDLYRIIEKDNPVLHLNTHTNPECKEGIYIQLALQECYDELQKRFEQEMESITLKTIIDRYHQQLSNPDQHDNIL